MSIHTHGAIALLALSAFVGCDSAPPPPDPKPFSVVVIGPRGELVTGPTVKVYGYVEGGDASVVQVGEASAQVGLGGSFEAKVPTGPDGLQTLMVTARPRAGGSPAKAEVAWTTDNGKPAITVTAPADPKLAVTRDALRIEGAVTDISPVLLTVDERPVALDGDRFEFTKMLAEGENTCTLVATDAAGHATTVTLTLRKDTEPPVCELEAATAVVRESSYIVKGSTGEAGCRVFVNGEEAKVDGATFSHELLLEMGDNAFDVVVRDAAGHQASASGTVRFERLDPPTKDELRARLEQELTANGGGWFTGQFADLEPFGKEIWKPLLEVAEEMAAGGDPRGGRLAAQAMEALVQLGVTDAIPFFQRLADTQPRGLGETAIWLLDRLGDSERADKRLDEMRTSIENDPASGPLMWGSIGDAHARMNHYDESRQAYLKAIEAARVLGQTTSTTVRSAWYNLSCQHCKLGDIDEALKAFDECQAIAGSDLDWAAKDGDLRQLRSKERFLKYFWESGTGPQLASRAMEIAKTHPESGLMILERGRDRLARDPNLLIFLALLYQQNDRADDATKTLEFVAQELPQLPWANIGKMAPLADLRANAKFRELTGAGAEGDTPSSPPNTPPGNGSGNNRPGAPAPAAAAGGSGITAAMLQQWVQRTKAPGRIALPADVKAGQYAQWTFTGNGRKMFWGVTAPAGDGWLVENRRQLKDGWITQAYAVDKSGTVRQAIVAAFVPGKGATGKPIPMEIGTQAVSGPDGGAGVGAGAEKITAAGKEWSCTVREADSNGRPMKQWVTPDVPFIGIVKVEIEGRLVFQLETMGDDAKPGVKLQASAPNQPKEGGF